jgi:hypothetical protein
VVEVKGRGIHKAWVFSGDKELPGVMSPQNLDYAEVDGEQFFTLWGCYPHLCGGTIGLFKFDVFQISSRKMMSFQVFQCDPQPQATDTSKRVCVTDLAHPYSTAPKVVQQVLTDAIHSAISEASDAAIEF